MRLRPAMKAILVGLAIVALLTELRWADFSTLRSVREFAFDQFQRLAPRAYEPTPVRIIDIDENSLKSLGQWPWPRTLVAKLSSRLNELGAAVVAFDVLFAEPDRLSPKNIMSEQSGVDPAIIAGLRDNDAVLAAQFAQQPVVLGFATNVNSPTYAQGQGRLCLHRRKPAAGTAAARRGNASPAHPRRCGRRHWRHQHERQR